MTSILELIRAQPLLLLFLIAGTGYLLGQIRIGGVSLGVAAVLFVGLAAGAIDPQLRLPDLLFQVGLAVFVYTVGLSSGPGFLASLRRRGLRDNLFLLGMLAAAGAVAALLAKLLDLGGAQAAGLFAGTFTNTPSLAAALDFLRGHQPAAEFDRLAGLTVTAYSVAYPAGVLGAMGAILAAQRLFRIDYAAEAAKRRELRAESARLINRTLLVTAEGGAGQTIGSIMTAAGVEAVFGRLRRAGHFQLATPETRLETGDLVTVTAEPEEMAQLVKRVGAVTEHQFELDRASYDHRRMFVSNPQVAGHTLAELNLRAHFGAIVTRIRRGDIDMLATPESVLELGDRVRVVARPQEMAAVGKYLGDSYHHLSEVDFLSLSLGLVIGLILGLPRLPLPGGFEFQLGIAGGPLIAGLALGAMRRWGPIVWTLPYSANLTLRQLGLILFLATVGTRSGYAFVTGAFSWTGLQLLAAATILAALGFGALILIGYRILRIPMGLLTGMLAAFQTQPATLAFALRQAGNELPNIGYATVYPLAMVAKVILVQVIAASL